jgi:hypothetical protein
MKDKPVITSNVMRFHDAVRQLRSRDVNVEGLGVLSGDTGEGKTTSVLYVCNLIDAVYLRARATWSASSMLRALVTELELTPTYRHDPMVQLSIDKLRLEANPVFIDEADYLLERPVTLDILRDIYDDAKVPVILIGSEDFVRRIRSANRYDKHRRRISQWIHFNGITFEDALKIERELLDIRVDEELLRSLFKASKGNIAAYSEGLRRIEALAEINEIEYVDTGHWDDRPFPQPTTSGFSVAGV